MDIDVVWGTKKNCQIKAPDEPSKGGDNSCATDEETIEIEFVDRAAR